MLDAYDDLDQIVNDPGEYGLFDVQDACITPGVAPFTCPKSNGYLLWDGIHPTKAGHAIIERFAASVLGLRVRSHPGLWRWDGRSLNNGRQRRALIRYDWRRERLVLGIKRGHMRPLGI